MNRAAEVCPQAKLIKVNVYGRTRRVSYNEMTKHGFVGQNFPSLKKGGRRKENHVKNLKEEDVKQNDV